MATKTPKSILKSSTAPGTQAADRAAAAKAREVATTHAKIIHQQRELEDQIGDKVLELSKYPLVREPSYTSSYPASSDIEAFKSGVRLFQPGDYDDLIEERNAEGRCGYTLCPNPRTRVRGGEWKIVGANIVPKKEIEKWCSPACAKRAMYVKVQLTETAAWERAGIDSIKIELYHEPEPILVKEMGNLKLDASRDAVKIARDLALERGDTHGEEQDRSVPIVLMEKKAVKAAEEPKIDPGNGEEGHLMLEGYRTKSSRNVQNA